ncbi:MAG: anti-sigma factor [Proteobacteria bacterium]|nr:anti-sigma factor [Pseudomonadota bacterium]
MTEPGDHMPDREALAAEYVLGTLPHAERLRAEALIAEDAGFRALVEGWQNRLAPLNDDYTEVPPPEELLGRIEDRLFPAPERPHSRGWLWGALAGLAAVALVAFVIPAILPPSGPPAITATLTGDGQPLVIAANYDPATSELTVERTAGPAAETGKDYELWIIPAGQAPISLGVVGEGASVLQLADLPAGSTLAITLEVAGGSPTGAAQGPLLVAAVIGDS